MKRAVILAMLIALIPVAQAVSLQGPPSDTTPPDITNIAYTHGAQTTITWDTNEPATSKIDYGTTRIDRVASSPELVTSHNLTIDTTPQETYQYTITSCDANNNCQTTPASTFVAGSIFVSATLPTFARSSRIDIPGTTRPNAEVAVIVNNVTQRRAIIDDGTFLFRNIELLRQTNTVTLEATLNGETARQTHTVGVDTQPPALDVSIAPVSMSSTTTATVTVSETVNLTITHTPPTEPQPPRPQPPQEERATATTIDITWEDVEEAEWYAVYRNGKRTAITQDTRHFDETVGSGATYQYQITAINEQCVESTLSDLLTASTEQGNKQEQAPQLITLPCLPAPKTITLQAGTAPVSVELTPGENLIEFRANDQAGFNSITEERVLYDTGPPQFLEHNLNQLSPSYSRTVTVRGKLSEQGSVTVFVNDQPKETQTTDENGNFAIPVTLERESVAPDVPPKQRQAIPAEIAWTSSVRLQAVDAAGQTASTQATDVKYAICGTGKWFNVQLSEPLPDTLNPRLLIEGLQQVGLGFEYEYQGGQDATVNANQVNVKILQFSPEESPNYDNGLISVYTPPVRAQRGEGKGKGYIQVNFRPITNPWRDLANEQAPADATLADKELFIAEHRRNDCLFPGLGCMRLMLELEIPFQEEYEVRGLPETTRRAETLRVENRVQRTCIPIEVAIDQPLPTDLIPNEMLRKTNKLLSNIIDGIDTVLKPIETIGKYLFYSCTVGQFLSLVPQFLERYNCEYKDVISKVTGEGGFDENIAEINACEEEYGSDTPATQNCQSCAEAKKRRKWFQHLYQQICDRVACPSAPSLQYYLKQQSPSQLEEVKLTNAQDDFTEYAVNGKYYIGNSCAAWVKQKQTEAQEQQNKRGIRPSLVYTPNQIQDIYNTYLDHKTDQRGEPATATDGINCAEGPAHPACCGYQYVQEWGSACGASAIGLDTFDEIEESTCLAAQKTGNNEIKGTGDEPIQCNSVSNALSGFCREDGGPRPEPIPVMPFSQNRLSEFGLTTAKEKSLFLIIAPIKNPKDTLYKLRLGYIREKIEFNEAEETSPLGDVYDINIKKKGREIRGSEEIERFFNRDNRNKYYEGTLPQSTYDDFERALCFYAGHGREKCGRADGKNVYDKVMAYIGTPDQEYIIRPRDGLINSVRCLCFPTLISYLKQWRDIMNVVKECGTTILTTGDGAAGLCKSIISKQVCDVMYDALSCFTRGIGAGDKRADLGIGNVFGALSAAGTRMSQAVEQRYGDTPMYKSVYVDQNLVHSTCMWAFTGTWNFNLATMYDQTVDAAPVESQALLWPCDRRFISFNPSTSPPGLTNWVYHFNAFLLAGADVDVSLKLKCSGGFNCQEQDGFAGGKCDCDTPQEITIQPEGLPTSLRKGDILNEELFYTMQGGRHGGIRYDKAYLEYTWHDGAELRTAQTEACTIAQTGGAQGLPGFCSFDVTTGKFRCSWGEAPGSIDFIGANVKYPYETERGGVFARNDYLDIDLQIRQDHNGQPEANKFLEYTITSPLGDVVHTNRGSLHPLNGNADYVKRVGPADSQLGIQIAPQTQWFPQITSGVSTLYKQWSSRRTGLQENSLVSSTRLTKDGTEIATHKRYVLSLAKAGENTYNYQVYRASGTQTDNDGFTVTTPTGCQGTLQLADNTITCEKLPEGDLTISLTRNRPTETNEKIQVHIDLNKPGAGNPCSEDNQYRPSRYTITFTAYDSDKWGTPSQQPSINPNTGEDVRWTENINIVCATKDKLKREGKLTTQPRLLDLLRDMKQFQRATIAFLNDELAHGQVEGNENYLTHPGTIESIRVEWGELLDFERQSLRTLQEAAVNAPLAAEHNNLITALDNNITNLTAEYESFQGENSLEVKNALKHIIATLTALNNAKDSYTAAIQAEMGIEEAEQETFLFASKSGHLAFTTDLAIVPGDNVDLSISLQLQETVQSGFLILTQNGKERLISLPADAFTRQYGPVQFKPNAQDNNFYLLENVQQPTTLRLELLTTTRKIISNELSITVAELPLTTYNLPVSPGGDATLTAYFKPQEGELVQGIQLATVTSDGEKQTNLSKALFAKKGDEYRFTHRITVDKETKATLEVETNKRNLISNTVTITVEQASQNGI